MRVSTFLLLFSLLVLVSCAGPATKTFAYTPAPTPGGRLCANQCQEAKSFCAETCDLHHRECYSGVEGRAVRDYDAYVRAQFASREPVELRPRDFERVSPCDDAQTSCTGSCDSHFQMCYENCGGKVATTTSCQFLCF